MGERDGRPLRCSSIAAADPREEEEPFRESAWRLEQPGDRTRRDEWSEDAVSALLDAYEARWALRNRAKLKGHDWEDVAHAVSERGSAKGRRKTATQCKNKVESMKKRYRSESAAGTRSKWPHFARLDSLVRRRPEPSAQPAGDHQSGGRTPEPPLQQQEAPASGGDGGVAALRKPAANGDARVTQVSRIQSGHQTIDGQVLECRDQASKEVTCSMDSARCASSEKKSETEGSKKKRKRKEEWDGDEVMQGMRRFGEVALEIERERREASREVERVRAEAEARIGEMELKRTEIMANTQLQIARLLVREDDHSNTNTK